MKCGEFLKSAINNFFFLNLIKNYKLNLRIENEILRHMYLTKISKHKNTHFLGKIPYKLKKIINKIYISFNMKITDFCGGIANL